MFKIIKLDRRMNGYGMFTHRVDATGMWGIASFELHEARSWLWERFGPGTEFQLLTRNRGLGHPRNTLHAVKWAWDTENYNLRLYVRDEILTQFLLVKERFEYHA
jgi:hypothetical protein